MRVALWLALQLLPATSAFAQELEQHQRTGMTLRVEYVSLKNTANDRYNWSAGPAVSLSVDAPIAGPVSGYAGPSIGRLRLSEFAEDYYVSAERLIAMEAGLRLRVIANSRVAAFATTSYAYRWFEPFTGESLSVGLSSIVPINALSGLEISTVRVRGRLHRTARGRDFWGKVYVRGEAFKDTTWRIGAGWRLAL